MIKIKRIIRQTIFQLAIVTQFHQQPSQEVGAHIFVTTQHCTPCIRIPSAFASRFIFHDELATAASQLLTKGFTLFIFLRKAELHRIDNHLRPMIMKQLRTCFVQMFHEHFYPHPAGLDHHFLQNLSIGTEFQNMKEPLGAVKNDTIDNDGGWREVTQHPPIPPVFCGCRWSRWQDTVRYCSIQGNCP